MSSPDRKSLPVRPPVPLRAQAGTAIAPATSEAARRKSRRDVGKIMSIPEKHIEALQ
jgi:hypothetical protein